METPADDARPTPRWDERGLRGVYANACNVTSSGDAIVMLFGLNQTWRPGLSDVTVTLSSRVILTPGTARRVLEALTTVLREHEARFGTIRT